MKNDIRDSSEFFEVARILGQQNDFQEIVRLVAHKAAQLLKADLALILMLNPDTRKTVKTIFKDGKTIEQQGYRDIHIHVGGWIINHKKPFLSHNIQKDDRFAEDLFKNIPVQSVAGVPLIIEGIIIGALILLYGDLSGIKDPDLITSLENLAAISAPYLRNAQKLREYFELPLPETSLLIKYNNAGLFGKSPRFIELLHATEAAAKCNARVLLIGDTGTGKELIAKAIHHYSSRSQNSFVAVDCGAIPDTLLESEFFGHTRGAFTGANSEHQGLFLEANGGTLFMDEINNLPYDMQSKLLRVLEENEVRPVGSNKVVKTDVRIIAASSFPLKQLVEEHHFREDLFFRLHVYPIYVPDLSERQEDIPLLSIHFLNKFAKEQNKKCQNFHEELIDFIKQRHWPGNIRELENFVERLVTLSPEDDTMIDAESFPDDLREELSQFRQIRSAQNQPEPLKNKVQEYEADLIKQTLIDCNWNQSEAARRLDTSEKNIRYKMEKMNIKKSDAD
jgi:transcriptional regulator with GAF, ATPase, and Fis domain